MCQNSNFPPGGPSADERRKSSSSMGEMRDYELAPPHCLTRLLRSVQYKVKGDEGIFTNADICEWSLQ